MIIPISKQYRIISDEYQWIIQKIRTRKGKEEWRACLYYPDLKSTVEGLGELMVRQSKADTLVSALAAVEEVATQLSQALTPKIEVKTGTDP
tara:strand:- start:2192 stop:2467 length:276 start_codon:yes stop_codon:yes gene_type:complete